MRLTIQQLGLTLRKDLAAVYLLHGDEPLQLGEAADAIRAAARQNGFFEREVLTVDAHFQWQNLFDSALSLSLFADKKILDLRIPEGKLGAEGAKALLEYCQKLPVDTLLLISAGKLAKEAYKSRWFETLDKSGVIVQVRPPEGKELESWLTQRAKARGLQIESKAIALLMDKLEGNLMAAAQEIERLYVLFGERAINAQAIEEVVADSSRYDVFKLVDACLAGKTKRVLKILHGLRDEAIAAPVVLWALTREARLLLVRTQHTKSFGAPQGSAWEQHKNLQTEAANRLKRQVLEAILLLGAKADQQIKGQQPGDAWETLLRICLLYTPNPVLIVEEGIH